MITEQQIEAAAKSLAKTLGGDWKMYVRHTHAALDAAELPEPGSPENVIRDWWYSQDKAAALTSKEAARSLIAALNQAGFAITAR